MLLISEYADKLNAFFRANYQRHELHYFISVQLNFSIEVSLFMEDSFSYSREQFQTDYRNWLIKRYQSDEKNIIVVGQSTCGYCVQAKLILNEIAEEKDVTINYLNVSYMTEEEGEKFESSLEYFEGSWGTPVMMIVQDGKMIDIVEQLVTKDEYIEFLEENEVL